MSTKKKASNHKQNQTSSAQHARGVCCLPGVTPHSQHRALHTWGTAVTRARGSAPAAPRHPQRCWMLGRLTVPVRSKLAAKTSLLFSVSKLLFFYIYTIFKVVF